VNGARQVTQRSKVGVEGREGSVPADEQCLQSEPKQLQAEYTARSVLVSNVNSDCSR